MNDAELLSLVGNERKSSIGFDHDATLQSDRERALRFYKGDMSKDVPALEGRSRAVSSDVADAVETVLPDLVEIFTGEEVAAFIPRGEEDEDAAEQETDYINHVFFNENPGFMILYTMFKDALLTKTGVVKWWSEAYEESETFTDKPLEEMAAALAKYGDALELDKDTPAFDQLVEGQTFTYTITRKGKKPKVCAVAPEDFTVSSDTVALKDTPYCAHRSRPRADELIKSGLSKELVDRLPAYGQTNEEMAQARDTAGEHNQPTNGTGAQRQVSVTEHIVRIEGKYWRVLTDSTDTILLEKEEVSGVRFAAVTPFIVTHRFYGESLADKLLEIMKIRTVLVRMLLDSGYFGLNQRMYVNMDKANDWTISDLLNNAPNMPVRGKGDGAVTPLSSAGLSFDAAGALEYFAVQGEQRTGVVRNAQGLNPDTLHDTAAGAMALMTASQKRVRLIARIFAETGLKDMFLGLHALIRETADGPMKARLRNKWVEIDPTSWGSRSDMTIEIGVGASGKEAQMMMLQQGLEAIQGIVTGQGGANGPIVTEQNVYAMTKRFFERGLGFKTADPFLTDPSEPKEGPEEPPPPDPALVEAQAKMQLEETKAASSAELARAKAEADIALAREKAEAEMLASRERHQLDLDQKREQFAIQLEFEREKAAAEIQMKREEMAFEFELRREAIHLDSAAKASTSINGAHPGGEAGA